MLEGYRTYITVAVGVLFGVARILGINFGITEDQFIAAVLVILTVAMGFLRRGVSKANGAGAGK